MPDRYVEKRSVLPLSYVEFIETNNGWEGDLGEEIGYVILWDTETIQERWGDYEMTGYLSDRWFPFGSNGGDEMLEERVGHFRYILVTDGGEFVVHDL
ncbi:MAG: SMI1/KNR4 family protein [Isosphaeraceae bacterium]